MFHHLQCGGRRLGFLAFACTVALAVSQPLWSASCVGPAPLEARAHSHPDPEAYAALGIWFGEHHESECAAQAFQSGLKLESNSSRLTYLLGLSLYTAGKLQESAVDLRSRRAGVVLRRIEDQHARVGLDEAGRTVDDRGVEIKHCVRPDDVDNRGESGRRDRDADARSAAAGQDELERASLATR